MAFWRERDGGGFHVTFIGGKPKRPTWSTHLHLRSCVSHLASPTPLVTMHRMHVCIYTCHYEPSSTQCQDAPWFSWTFSTYSWYGHFGGGGETRTSDALTDLAGSDPLDFCCYNRCKHRHVQGLLFIKYKFQPHITTPPPPPKKEIQ